MSPTRSSGSATGGSIKSKIAMSLKSRWESWTFDNRYFLDKKMEITETFAIDHFGKRRSKAVVYILLLMVVPLVFFSVSVEAQSDPDSVDRIRQTIETLASFNDRATGTKGNKASAEYIKKMFSEIGLEQVGSIPFAVPVLKIFEMKFFHEEKMNSARALVAHSVKLKHVSIYLEIMFT